MKKKFLFTLCLSSLLAVSCSDSYDDTGIRNDITDLDNRVQNLEKLCQQMNTNLSSLQSLMQVLQQNDYITGITPLTENGKEVGYTIQFYQHAAVTIYHGKDGADGSDGQDGVNGSDGITPQLKIENGYWFVSYDKGSSWQQLGNAVSGSVIVPQFRIQDKDWYVSYDNGTSWQYAGKATGDDGQPGAGGTTPQLKIVDGYWQVSYDNGATWTQLGKATGDAGGTGQATPIPQFMIQNGRWCISYDNGNSWVDLGQATGDPGNTPQFKTEDGYWFVSYDYGQSWIQLGKATGETGATGPAGNTPQFKIENNSWYVSYDNGLNWNYVGQATGAQGNDGATPKIGVRQDSDGKYYWTLNGGWLLDDNGQKVIAEGTDGAAGNTGAAGKDGVTPKLKIENDYWYVSYDNGSSWTQLGRATGSGSSSGTGSSLFTRVDTTQPGSVTFYLTDGSSFTVPRGASLDITFDETDGLAIVPGLTLTIPYTLVVQSGTPQVEAIGSDGIKVLVHENGNQGTLEILATEAPDKYSKVLVFLTCNGQTVVRALTFEEGTIVVVKDTYVSEYESQTLTIPVETNLEYDVEIEEAAQSWLSLRPQTKAMRREELVFDLKYSFENQTRSATVTLRAKSFDYTKQVVISQLSYDYGYLTRAGKDVTLDMDKCPNQTFWLQGLQILADEGYENYRIIGTYNEHYWLSVLRDNPSIKSIDLSGITGMVELPANVFYGDLNAQPMFFQQLTEVRLPADLASIGAAAFANCPELVTVTNAEQVSNLGDAAFGNCAKLSSLSSFPNVTTLTGGTFASCQALTSMDLPLVVSISGSGTFYKGRFTTVKLPLLATIHGNTTFSANSFTTLNLPALKSITGNETFRYCSHLETLNLPELVSITGEGDRNYTFGDCTSLTTLNMPKVETLDGRNMFSSTTKLTTLSLPKLRSVGELVFRDASLASLKVPQLTQIGAQAFRGCTQLQELFLTSPDDIILGTDWVTNSVAAKCTLHLYTNKQSEVTNGNEWGGYTWKAIEFEN